METLIKTTFHRPSASCTDTCKPATFLVGLNDDGTWAVHWPHAHPDMATTCGWCSPSVLFEVPAEAMPFTEGQRVGCPDCFPTLAADDCLARWLA